MGDWVSRNAASAAILASNWLRLFARSSVRDGGDRLSAESPLLMVVPEVVVLLMLDELVVIGCGGSSKNGDVVENRPVVPVCEGPSPRPVVVGC